MPTTYNQTPGSMQPVHRDPVLNSLDYIALVLLIVGGLNWASVGLFQFDLVAAVFGVMSIATRFIYVLVGLAAIYAIALCVRWAGK